MPDLDTQLRAYFESIAPPLDTDQYTSHPASLAGGPVRSRGWMVAAVAAAVTLIVVGGLALFLGAETPDVAASPDMTQASDSPDPIVVLPTVQLDGIPRFEAVVRYHLDGREGFPSDASVDVLISFDPPDSFRREIIALDPPEMEFRFGKVGEFVATDGSFPILTGETTEEGEALGPLVWPNWESACTQPPEAAAIEIDGGVTLTVVECEAADPQWVRAGEPWTIRVDAATGLVFEVEAELDGGEFRIPGTRMEILSLDSTPEFAPSYFATPVPDPPAIPGEPFAFTYTIDDGREVAVSWLSDNTWRWDYIVGGGSGLGSGSYQIYADGTFYTYNTNTNEYLEERFIAFDGRLSLVEWVCEESGTCKNAENPEDEGKALTCEVSDGGTVLGRPVTRYDCEPTIWFGEQTFWMDNELGYILKSDGPVEVLTIDLAPSFDPELFEQKCPTADCAAVDTG